MGSVIGGDLARFCQERKSHDMLFLCEVVSLYYFKVSIANQCFEAHVFGAVLPGVVFDISHKSEHSHHTDVLLEMVTGALGDCSNDYLLSFVKEKDSAWHKTFYSGGLLISQDCIKKNPPREFTKKMDQFFSKFSCESNLTDEQKEDILKCVFGD